MIGIIEQLNPEPPCLIIPAHIFDSMLAHCRSEYPNEACGILAGKGMIVSQIFIMTNTIKSPSSYLMDSEEQFNMMKELRDKSLQMTAIYHSHPDSLAYPSSKDLEMAYYEDSFYLIISLADGGAEVKVFLIKDGQAKEVKIAVIPESRM